MKEIRIYPLGIRRTYSQISREDIYTYTADLYLYDDGISTRVGHVMKEDSGAKTYHLHRDYQYLLPEVKEVCKVLGHGAWPSVVHYPHLVERATQTESAEVTQPPVLRLLLSSCETMYAAPAATAGSAFSTASLLDYDADADNDTSCTSDSSDNTIPVTRASNSPKI